MEAETGVEPQPRSIEAHRGKEENLPTEALEEADLLGNLHFELVPS